MRVLYRFHSSGRWLLRVPAVLRVAEREHALLGARLLLVAARAADGGIEAVLVQRLLQALGLHHVGVHGGAVADRADAVRDAVGIDVHAQVDAGLGRAAVAEGDHLAELPARCRRAAAGSAAAPARRPSAAGAAAPSCPCRPNTASPGCGTRRDLAQDVQALGFEAVQMAQLPSIQAPWPVRPYTSS